jgi:hypothetical protein
MTLIIKDRILETSTTTGTGNITLNGAVTGYRAFSSVCATGDTLYYLIEAVDSYGVPTGDWETGLGTYSSANTLTRTTVKASSNSGSAVSFITGTKRVSISSIAASVAWKPEIPKAADFTTLRNGTLTAATIASASYGSGVKMTFQRNSSANWAQSYILKSAPSGSFRVEALISNPLQSVDNWFMTGLTISTSNAADVAKHVSVDVYNNGGSWLYAGYSRRNNGLNAQETAWTTVTAPQFIAGQSNQYWLAIEYDGTNINAYISFDGYAWTKTASEPATYFTGTPDLVGFGWESVASDGGTHYVWCPHFKTTTTLSDPFGLNT